MIAINWGSSNFRAYWLDAHGAVQAERTSERRAAAVPRGGFPDALRAEIGDWISTGESRLLMSGMVGSRLGWEEAPYVEVPASFEQIASRVMRLNVGFADVRIVPGLIGTDESGVPELIRGEETEILGTDGILSDMSYLCLPGTHTKWVRVKDGIIFAFSTSMTGDLYRAVRENTVIGTVIQGDETDQEAFLQGVGRSQQRGDLLHHLFGVRTLVLTEKIRHCSALSYLSGILIGHDVKSMVRRGEAVHLVGESELCALYATALRSFDVRSTIERPSAALRGLMRIARRLEW